MEFEEELVWFTETIIDRSRTLSPFHRYSQEHLWSELQDLSFQLGEHEDGSFRVLQGASWKWITK